MKETFDITGMTCAACSARVQKAAGEVPGVEQANVNLLKNSMELVYDGSPATVDAVCAAIDRAGYGAKPRSAQAGQGRSAQSGTVDTAQQAIDTFKEADSVVVEGDEVKVRVTGSPYLVTNADSNYGYAGINTAGRVFLQPRKDIVKTGRHFDSVDDYLKGGRE